MHVTQRLLLSILLAASSNLHAGGSPEDIQALHDLLHPISGLSAQFKQQIQDADGSALQVSEGLFQVAQPAKLRWIVKQPIAQQIISDGTHLWLYDPDLEQVIIQPFVEDITASPISLFSGNLEGLDKAYLIVYLHTENPALESYLLTPKSTGTLYTTLRIDFVALIPKAIELVDSLGQTTHIDLHNVVINPPLSDDLFTFEIPSGVDVVNNAD